MMRGVVAAMEFPFAQLVDSGTHATGSYVPHARWACQRGYCNPSSGYPNFPQSHVPAPCNAAFVPPACLQSQLPNPVMWPAKARHEIKKIAQSLGFSAGARACLLLYITYPADAELLSATELFAQQLPRSPRQGSW